MKELRAWFDRPWADYGCIRGMKQEVLDALAHQSRCITKDRLAHFIQFYILVMSHLVNNDKDKWIYTFLSRHEKSLS